MFFKYVLFLFVISGTALLPSPSYAALSESELAAVSKAWGDGETTTVLTRLSAEITSLEDSPNGLTFAVADEQALASKLYWLHALALTKTTPWTTSLCETAYRDLLIADRLGFHEDWDSRTKQFDGLLQELLASDCLPFSVQEKAHASAEALFEQSSGVATASSLLNKSSEPETQFRVLTRFGETLGTLDYLYALDALINHLEAGEKTPSPREYLSGAYWLRSQASEALHQCDDAYAYRYAAGNLGFTTDWANLRSDFYASRQRLSDCVTPNGLKSKVTKISARLKQAHVVRHAPRTGTDFEELLREPTNLVKDVLLRLYHDGGFALFEFVFDKDDNSYFSTGALAVLWSYLLAVSGLLGLGLLVLRHRRKTNA